MQYINALKINIKPYSFSGSIRQTVFENLEQGLLLFTWWNCQWFSAKWIPTISVMWCINQHSMWSCNLDWDSGELIMDNPKHLFISDTDAVGKLQIHTKLSRLSLQSMRILVNDPFTYAQKDGEQCHSATWYWIELENYFIATWYGSYLPYVIFRPIYLITCKLHSIPSASINYPWH